MNSFPVGYRIPKKKLEAIPKKKSETAVMKLVNINNSFACGPQCQRVIVRETTRFSRWHWMRAFV